MQNSDLATCCRYYGYWPVFTTQLHNYIAPTEVVEAMFCFFDYQHIWTVIVCWGDICNSLFVNYLFCGYIVASYREASVYSLIIAL